MSYGLVTAIILRASLELSRVWVQGARNSVVTELFHKIYPLGSWNLKVGCKVVCFTRMHVCTYVYVFIRRLSGLSVRNLRVSRFHIETDGPEA
jgi:hypothetical protein